MLLLVGGFLAVVWFFATRTLPGYHFLFFPFGLLWALLLLFLVFGVLRWVFWSWGWRRRAYYWRNYDQAHQILRERYARGEITKEQFDQMTRDLDEHS